MQDSKKVKITLTLATLMDQGSEEVIMEDLYIKIPVGVFKVLNRERFYNYMAERYETEYEIMEDFILNEYTDKFEISENIHDLIDEYIIEREIHNEIVRQVSPCGEPTNYDSINVYGAIWAQNGKGMPFLKPVCKFKNHDNFEL